MSGPFNIGLELMLEYIIFMESWSRHFWCHDPFPNKGRRERTDPKNEPNQFRKSKKALRDPINLRVKLCASLRALCHPLVELSAPNPGYMPFVVELNAPYNLCAIRLFDRSSWVLPPGFCAIRWSSWVLPIWALCHPGYMPFMVKLFASICTYSV